jgi:ferritin-like metal-binding protein YciE
MRANKRSNGQWVCIRSEAALSKLKFGARFARASKEIRQSLITGEPMIAFQSLENLFVHELRDVLSAERQLVEALPKMAKAAANPMLRAGFEEHLEQTKGQVQRLEQIFEELGKSPKSEKCIGMEGLVAEAAPMLEEQGDPAVIDVALIAAAQRVEHYEIAAYGTLRTLAQTLGMDRAATLLGLTLQEEKDTDRKLSELAKFKVNADAEPADAR